MDAPFVHRAFASSTFAIGKTGVTYQNLLSVRSAWQNSEGSSSAALYSTGAYFQSTWMISAFCGIHDCVWPSMID